MAYTAIEPQPRPFNFASVKKFVRRPVSVSITLLRVVPLLVRRVQVSFVPASEVLPFSQGDTSPRGRAEAAKRGDGGNAL